MDGCRCASTKIAQPDPRRRKRIIKSTGNGNELGRYGGVQIGSPEIGGPLERTILIEDNARGNEGGPWQEVSEARRRIAIFSKVHHGQPHTPKEAGDAQVPAHHVDEQGIALRCPDRQSVTNHPQQEAGDPEPQTKTERGRQACH